MMLIMRSAPIPRSIKTAKGGRKKARMKEMMSFAETMIYRLASEWS